MAHFVEAPPARDRTAVVELVKFGQVDQLHLYMKKGELTPDEQRLVSQRAGRDDGGFDSPKHAVWTTRHPLGHQSDRAQTVVRILVTALERLGVRVLNTKVHGANMPIEATPEDEG